MCLNEWKGPLTLQDTFMISAYTVCIKWLVQGCCAKTFTIKPFSRWKFNFHLYHIFSLCTFSFLWLFTLSPLPLFPLPESSTDHQHTYGSVWLKMGRYTLLSFESPIVPLPSAVTHLREGTCQLPLKPRLALFWWYKEVQVQDFNFSSCPIKP